MIAVLFTKSGLLGFSEVCSVRGGLCSRLPGWFG